MQETLASYSLIAVYSAAMVYMLAFIAFVLDLAKRSSQRTVEQAAEQRTLVQSSVLRQGSGGSAAVIERVEAKPKASKHQRVGFALTIIAFLLHAGATIMRGVAAERVPWANMYEFALTGTAIIAGLFLVAQFWKDLAYLGAYVTGIVLVFLCLATINFYVDVVPLHPALQSAWIVIHVLVAILGTGFFALGAGLSILQLLQSRREAGRERGLGFLRTLPDAVGLESLAYRVNVAGFVFWTFTLIAGAIWAERAWGRYWGWDVKEVWTFIIWVLFAGYIHARATRGWRGSRSAWLAIIGFAAVLFNFTGVNILFDGLHSYSGLD